jgi:hypothetical protein
MLWCACVKVELLYEPLWYITKQDNVSNNRLIACGCNRKNALPTTTTKLAKHPLDLIPSQLPEHTNQSKLHKRGRYAQFDGLSFVFGSQGIIFLGFRQVN